jgi:hypothetical protein
MRGNQTIKRRCQIQVSAWRQAAGRRMTVGQSPVGVGRILESFGARQPRRAFVRKNAKLKTKSPMPQRAPRCPLCFINCGEAAPKMIRFDSLSENFRAPPAVRGVGGLNPWAVWGPLPHGVSRTDFFWSGRGLNYFSEIKEIKRPSANRSRASRVFSRRWIRRLGLSPRQIALGRAFIFQAHCVGGGQKVWDPQAGTAAGASSELREIGQTFLSGTAAMGSPAIA